MSKMYQQTVALLLCAILLPSILTIDLLNVKGCKYTQWKYKGICSAACGPGLQPQVRYPYPSNDTSADPYCNQTTTRSWACNVKECPSRVVQPVFHPEKVLKPALAVAGVAGTTAAVVGFGALLGESLAAFAPLLLLGKRSTLDEKELLDLFILKLQEKRKTMS